MILEIQKRPFVRPLCIWITGIILQTILSVRILFFGLLVIPFLALTFSVFVNKRNKTQLIYGMRWVWGLLFTCLLLFLSIQITAYHESRPMDTSTKLHEIAKSTQQNLVGSFEKLSISDTEKSVLSTITLGYREIMPKEVRQQFSLTGVAHILAVSGFHIGVVAGFLLWIFSFLSHYAVGRWIRYIITLLLIGVFTSVTGFAASAVRAALMLTLYLTGRQLRYTTDRYNTLAASAFCMLVYNPFYLFDIGFQLSYLAVYFILYLQPRISKWIDVKNPLLATPWGWITVTLSAQTGVTFLCLYYFGQFSTVFIFTNLPLTLISTLLIPLTLTWIMLPAWLPGVQWLQSCIEWLVHSMVWIVDRFSHIPGSSLSFPFGFEIMILSYGCLIIFLLYINDKRPRLLIMSFFILFIIMFILLIEKYLQLKI